MGLAAYLFLFIFQPFGTHTIPDLKLLSTLAPYFLIAFLVFYGLNTLLPESAEEWNWRKEIFRGILFGLLLSALRQNIPFLGNPALLITSALFGFMHALTLSENYSIRFNALYFIQTAFAGWVWGWVTLRSRSILMPVLSHNLSNFFGTLVTMLK